MKKNIYQWTITLLFFSIVATAQQIASIDKAEVRRGDKLTIQLKDTVKDPPVIRLVRRDCYDGKSQEQCSISLQSQIPEAAPSVNPQTALITTGKQLSVLISALVPLGNYVVCLDFPVSGSSSTQVDMCNTEPSIWKKLEGKHVENPAINLKVSPPQGTQLTIKDVFPTVGYSQKNDKYAFTVRGSGFSTVPQDNHLVLDRVGEVRIRWTSQAANRDCKDALDYGGCGEVISPLELKFWGITKPDVNGPRNLQILVGEEKSDVVSPSFLLSPVNKGTPLLIALAAVALLAFLGFFFIKKSRGGGTLNRDIDGKKFGIVSAFLIDPETDTYSLSKLQFYLWTGAAVFGYVYLLVSRSLVQGKFEFVDVPENLPGIIGISAFTGAAALGITTAKGSKGSGETRPSVADFLTTGGVVSAERVQFLVWTVLGAAVFVFLTISFDPGVIKDLPSVPERFLYLMGLSSFGYLGGKLARKPGPVIDKIVSTSGSLKLEVHGSYLSEDASFSISDDAQGNNSVDVVPDARDADGKDHRPVVIAKDTKADSPGIASVLLLKLSKPAEKWLKGKHYLKMVNPDGQKAVWWFQVDLEGANPSEPKPDIGPASDAPAQAFKRTEDAVQALAEAIALMKPLVLNKQPAQKPESSASPNNDPEISARDV